jgi:hypothetical protein
MASTRHPIVGAICGVHVSVPSVYEAAVQLRVIMYKTAQLPVLQVLLPGGRCQR